MRALGIMALCAAVSACASAATQHVFNTRPLTPNEKEALRSSLSRTLKDPSSAQFKWMPAIVPGPKSLPDDLIGYCALVNGKNSYGGYAGFKRFYARLARNANNEYIAGTIEHIEGAPITFGGASTVEDAAETGAVEGSCEAWGYTDFSQAQ
ncbi:MAG TPA: hypothetical protein VK749_01705 [Xanthobacteraceae bacterium]|jgi:hypothetical protein|nr:hypothetical protein [Xanthobacteraceae bacterium]